MVGLARVELLKSFMGLRNSETKKTVLVLDFHTNPNPLDDAFNPFFNWESNKAFYQDILRLAAIHPKVKFIIRGKDDAWCSVPFFKGVVAQVEATPNVEVNREYDEVNVSYKLAATADLIIARQTSLGDEAMAAGIPVLSTTGPLCVRITLQMSAITMVFRFTHSHSKNLRNAWATFCLGGTI